MLDRRFVKLIRAFVPLAMVALVSRVAAASEPTAAGARANRERAAAAYDEAVRLSERANYEAAARKFLEADAILPSVDALSNAIAAARRANADLLVAEAAERAVRREQTEPELAASARAALAEAEVRLSRLVLSCEPAPCELDLDGSKVSAGRRYVLPGVHVMSAIGPHGARTEERLTTSAGAEYVVALEATPTPPATTTPASAGGTVSAPHAATRSSESRPRARPLRPWVFYVGLGTTVALAGVTIWSGVDALNAKSDLPNPSTKGRNDDVLGRAHRTDWLLGGTVVAAAASAYVGLVLVDWKSSERATLTLLPTNGGAVVGLAGAH